MLINLASLSVFAQLNSTTIVVGDGGVKIGSDGRPYGDRPKEAIEAATHFTVGGEPKTREEMQNLLGGYMESLADEGARDRRRKELEKKLGGLEARLRNPWQLECAAKWEAEAAGLLKKAAGLRQEIETLSGEHDALLRELEELG